MRQGALAAPFFVRGPVTVAVAVAPDRVHPARGTRNLMESIFLLLGLLVLGLVVLGPTAFFMGLAARRRLDMAEARLAEAEKRLRDLTAGPAPAPSPEPVPGRPPAPAPAA
ncbi:MAG: hypothetical protein JWN93_3754, partial [Hyphomicrobiales bacterium]|nr:hypothetical protein [Hyphomicrobiales bacterium]